MKPTAGTLLQISAGTGPWEVRRFVAALAQALQPELLARGILITSETTVGDAEAPFSITFSLEGHASSDLTDLTGTHALVARSPRRAKSARKRWFAAVQLHPSTTAEVQNVAEEDVEFQATRAGGPGGQSVNTTASAVRALHRPTGISVRVVTERSQHANRRLALERLSQVLAERALTAQSQAQKALRISHHRLERGRPVRTWRMTDDETLRPQLPERNDQNPDET